MRIEWRTKAQGDDALLAISEGGDSVVRAWTATAPLITEFLNDMAGLDPNSGPNGLDAGQRDPQNWGRLVLARSNDGEILQIDPELYWDGISYWFRSHGDDPNRWRR